MTTGIRVYCRLVPVSEGENLIFGLSKYSQFLPLIQAANTEAYGVLMYHFICPLVFCRGYTYLGPDPLEYHRRRVLLFIAKIVDS